jgi:preprotein translocase subunit SecG
LHCWTASSLTAVSEGWHSWAWDRLDVRGGFCFPAAGARFGRQEAIFGAAARAPRKTLIGGLANMNPGAIIVNILQVLFSVSIIIIVLLQSGKSAGLSGSIAGGAETFFGKSKGRTIDAMLGKYTTFASIAFLITSIILFVFLKKPV